MFCVVKKGFTLVELLIVILVIGILSVMMIISASEVITTAKATQIIANLKQLETAAMAWYWDNHGVLAWSGTDTNSGDGYTYGGQNQKENGVNPNSLHEKIKADNSIITRYLDNPNLTINEGNKEYQSEKKDGLYAKLNGYSVYLGNGNKELYVFYRLSNDSYQKDNARLREKLKDRAKSANLVTYINAQHRTYDGANVVGKLVMNLGSELKK